MTDKTREFRVSFPADALVGLFTVLDLRPVGVLDRPRFLVALSLFEFNIVGKKFTILFCFFFPSLKALLFVASTLFLYTCFCL